MMVSFRVGCFVPTPAGRLLGLPSPVLHWASLFAGSAVFAAVVLLPFPVRVVARRCGACRALLVRSRPFSFAPPRVRRIALRAAHSVSVRHSPAPASSLPYWFPPSRCFCRG